MEEAIVAVGESIRGRVDEAERGGPCGAVWMPYLEGPRKGRIHMKGRRPN